MILACLILLGATAGRPDASQSVMLTHWAFHQGDRTAPEQIDEQAEVPGEVRRCDGPWGLDGKSGVCWTDVTLESVPPGQWLVILGRQPLSSLTVNGKTRPTSRQAATGLTLCSFDSGSLVAGVNTLSVTTPAVATPSETRRGPLALLSPDRARWLNEIAKSRAGTPMAGNLSILSGIGPNGAVLPRVWVNGCDRQGFHLAALAGLSFRRHFEDHTVRLRDVSMQDKRVTAAPPQSIGVFRDARLGDLTFTISAWAPVAVDDPAFSSIPALTTTIAITTHSRTEIPIDTIVDIFPLEGGSLEASSLGDYAVVHNESLALAVSNAQPTLAGGPIAELISSQKAAQPERALRQVRIDLVLMALDKRDAAAADWRALLRLVLDRTPERRRALRAFRAPLPLTGRPRLDARLRLSSSSAWLAARRDEQGRVEPAGKGQALSADGYFSSYAALLVYPGLEREAVLADDPESASLFGQTLAILRAHRFRKWNPAAAPDGGWLEQTVARCDRLLDLDKDRDALPDQPSLEPAEAFAFLAALRQTAALAAEDGQTATAERLEGAYERASARVHAASSQGGLWNGSAYLALPPGPAPPRSQILGVVLDEVPADRIAAVLDAARSALAAADPLARSLGDHLEPLLAWGFFAGGRHDEALDILEAWASASDPSLTASSLETGDLLRAERTSAAALAAMQFGFLGIDRRSAGELAIAPSRLAHPPFSIRLHLPEGNLSLAVRPERQGVQPVRVTGSLEHPLRLSITLPGADQPTIVELPASDRFNLRAIVE